MPAYFQPIFTVQSATRAFQLWPTVTALTNGNFVVSWQSTEVGSYAVRARLYNQFGTALGPDFVANTSANELIVGQSTILPLNSGRFIVAWPDPLSDNIEARNYLSTGLPSIGGEYTIVTGPNSYTDPASALLNNDTHVFVWTSRGATPAIEAELSYIPDINIPLVTGTGSARFSDLDVEATPTGGISGGFVITYTYQSSITATSDVRMARFSATGNPLGAPVTVNTTIAGSQLGSDVAVLTDGRMVVVWTDASAAADSSIKARVYSDIGVALGVEFRINSTATSSSEQPAITALQDGRFLVAWAGESSTAGGGYDVFARIYNANGIAAGTDFVVDASPFYIFGLAVDKLVNGNVAITWHSSPDGLSSTTIRSTIINPNYFVGTTAGDNWQGGAGNEVLTGGDGIDILRGGAGNDTVYGGNGNDVLRGETGNDVMHGNAGADYMDGGTGVDSVSYAFDSAAVWTSIHSSPSSLIRTGAAIGDTYVSIENLFGTAVGNDILEGSIGNNELRGFNGNDRLEGAEGNDTLIGGNGADSLVGGTGSDRFRYDNVSERGDQILNFDASDYFFFKGSAFGTLPIGALDATRFRSGKSNAAGDADDRFIYRATDDTLWFDLDGTGAGATVLIADISNDFVLTAADIFIV